MTKGNETGRSDWDERKAGGGMTVEQWKAPRNGISGGVQMKRATGSRGSTHKDLKGGQELGMPGEERKSSGELELAGT